MWYNPGDVVRVRVSGFIEHDGILTKDGRVISNSRRRGGVFEESVRDFTGGRKMENLGPLSGRDPNEVLAAARARIGRKYDAFNYNCQHFVHDCYGLGAQSHQKNFALGAAALAALLIII